MGRKRLSDIPNLEGYGVFVDGIDFQHLSREEWKELGMLHMKKPVMVIRNTGLKRQHFHKLMRAWGRDRQNYAATLFSKYPWADKDRHKLMDSPEVTDHEKAILKEYDKIGGNTAGAVLRVCGDGTGLFAHGELLWHSNESGDIAFTPGVALLGDHGMTESATGFMVTTPYYYSLSESMRSELDEMVLVHNFQDGKINVEGENNLLYKNMCPEPDTEIPLVIQSPGGIKGLHFPYNTTSRIKDYPIEESVRLLNEIRWGLDKYTYDYWWENDDDLLIFDNSIVQHRRLGDTSNRLCHRYQFDYTYLSYTLNRKPYQPYLQEPYISRYIDKMKTVSLTFQNIKV